MGNLVYPSLDTVNNASHIQICTWHRFLPSPKDKGELSIINAIYDKFIEGGGMTPSISKEIGWEG